MKCEPEEDNEVKEIISFTSLAKEDDSKYKVDSVCLDDNTEHTLFSTCSMNLKQERYLGSELDTAEIEAKYDDTVEDIKIKLEPLLTEEFDVKEELATLAPVIGSSTKSEESKCIFAHQNTVSTCKKALLRCNNCEYTTPIKGVLRKHMKTHRRCADADNEFIGADKDKLKMLNSLQCDTYNFITVRNNGRLKQDVKIHSSKKPFKCNLCEYTTAHSRHLYQHMKTHSNKKPFECTICHYKTAHSKRDLQRHMNIHSGKQQHVNIYSGEMPFHCKICDYKTHHKKSLVQHMKRHTGEKPFQCNICEYKTAYDSNFRRHMKMHTGEKPFGCKICKYKTAQQTHLRRHMQRHLRNKKMNLK